MEEEEKKEIRIAFNAPLTPREGETPRWAEVIDIGEFRVEMGFPKRNYCRHTSLLYSSEERRVWCKDCHATLDPFDAFTVLVRELSAIHRHLGAREARLKDMVEGNLNRIAAKELDKIWSGNRMAPVCPHCGKGLLPEDFANGFRGSVSAEIERQRRKSGSKEG